MPAVLYVVCYLVTLFVFCCVLSDQSLFSVISTISKSKIVKRNNLLDLHQHHMLSK